MNDKYLEQLQSIQLVSSKIAKSKASHPIYDFIAIQVTHFRHAANLSQEELAEKVGLTRTSITNMEAGRQRMPIHVLVNIAEALGKDIVDFFPPDKKLLTYAPAELNILQLPHGAKILELLQSGEEKR